MAKFYAENPVGMIVRLKGRDLHTAAADLISRLAKAKIDDAQFDVYEDDAGNSYMVGVLRKDGGEISFSFV